MPKAGRLSILHAATSEATAFVVMISIRLRGSSALQAARLGGNPSLPLAAATKHFPLSFPSCSLCVKRKGSERHPSPRLRAKLAQA